MTKTATKPEQRVFTEPEAAEFLRLTKRQLADERRRDRITFSRIVGRRVRYTLADLEQYLESRRVAAAESN